MPKKHPNIYYYIIIYNILSCGLEILDISAEKTSESLPPSQGIITFGNGHWGSVLVYTPPQQLRLSKSMRPHTVHIYIYRERLIFCKFREKFNINIYMYIEIKIRYYKEIKHCMYVYIRIERESERNIFRHMLKETRESIDIDRNKQR